MSAAKSAEQLDRPRLRVGILGCGGIARQFHIGILAADRRVELVGAADPDRESRQLMGRANGVPVYGDLDEMLEAGPVDAVVICAATPVHPELAVAVASRGLHMYLEKPIAVDLDRGRSVLEAAERSAGTAQVGFNHRFHPQLIELRSLLDHGVIGTPRRARSVFVEGGGGVGPEWKLRRRTGGGALLDLGSHDLDLARWLLGDEIEEVTSADIRSVVSEQDHADFSLRMSSGTIVEQHVALGGEGTHRWLIEGSSGIVRFDQWPARVTLGERQSRRWRVSRSLRRSLPIPRREPSFKRALGAFVAYALGEPVATPPTLTDGFESLRQVLAVERAAGLE